ncbi:serine/threonine-protein kinase [Rugamonas sp.]|uniref:serine/threonine-protein kinase n=1 Tax=Rugamonas sp. TaxID=1926287 RepID=UPI0025CBE53E|nr:serine/threonine-protein kinase [Rugamonas sp.]
MNELKQLGRYQLLRVLGRGAMGLVYEGVDPKLNRRVAVKVILTSRIDAEQRADYSARFIQEAQAVARLNHPNIVTVYDFGEEHGIAYLVMELIAGEELGNYFDENQAFSLDFTLVDSVRMTCELLNAVAYAHQHGVIHRDIKPANVMLGTQLRVKLTDFGVACLTSAATDEAGAMVGTPSYMSPEQIAGRGAGPQSDIFAVGIILYQFLTSQKPFRGQGLFALQQKILYEQPVLPSLLSPSLDPVFDRIVLRALAKRPEDRYADANAFRDELQRALDGENIAPDTTMPPRVQGVNPFLSAPAATFATSMATAPSVATAWRPAPDDGDPDATRILPFPAGIGIDIDIDATIVAPALRDAGR